MAQTKRKRQTKHKGNAAGVIERRGGNSKRPDPPARNDPKATAQARRMERMNRPPTWRSAVNKAGIAALIFAVFVFLVLQEPIAGALGLALVTFAVYVPLSFYTDRFVYQRNQKKLAAVRGAKQARPVSTTKKDR